MSTIKDGGPAFPRPAFKKLENGFEVIDRGSPGMTLRDYAIVAFAAAWVTALASRGGESDEDAAWEANRLATRQANAMLAAREAQP